MFKNHYFLQINKNKNVSCTKHFKFPIKLLNSDLWQLTNGESLVLVSQFKMLFFLTDVANLGNLLQRH